MRAVPAVPGLVLAAVAAVLGQLVAGMTPLPPVFFALAIGVAVGSFVPRDRLAPGVCFASREVLRFGVALLGLAITFGEIATLGWAAGLVVIGALALTLVFGASICRLLGETRGSSIVSAAAVAICGASAAMAIAAALPKGNVKDDEVARSVAGITIAGSVALVLFPFLAATMGMSALQAGVLLGGSIHEVAQAAAAGFAVSEEVGKFATIAKMLRVACMGAIVSVVGLMASRGAPEEGRKPPLFPGFLIAFVLLAAVSSFGFIPAALKDAAIDISRWCLLIAIAALGMRTSSATLIRAGAGPLLAIAFNSILLAALMVAGVVFIG